MKEKNKGFTLIELLAVIVVLAIIMVIATTLVSKQIKKSKKNANEINKEMIVKAVKTCLVENTEEECDTIEKLQKNGYLDSFEDPWNKKNDNLDDSYTIVISDDDARVIYFGEGITEEVETPPNEYFSLCKNSTEKDLCIDGLTSEGKKWLQDHDDILIFPSGTKSTTIKDCESTGKNCTNFSGVNIEALIITSKTSVNANFSNSTINVVRIDSGSIGNSKFQKSKIKKLVLGNASYLIVNEATFSGSTIDYFKIESGKLNWQAFTGNKINTLEIGKDVDYIGGNLFNGATIKKLIFNSEKIISEKNYYKANAPFKAKIEEIVIGDNVTIIPENLFYVYIGNSNAVLKKITIGKNVKTIEPKAFRHHVNNGSGCGNGGHANCLYTKGDGKTYVTSDEYNTNPTEYARQGYCKDIFCEISSIEEIVIKGDPNRFDDVWNKIPFPPKDKVKISTQ